jgi:multidrug efflux pump subunit AcrA (membrane-fusion protein)
MESRDMDRGTNRHEEREATRPRASLDGLRIDRSSGGGPGEAGAGNRWLVPALVLVIVVLAGLLVWRWPPGVGAVGAAGAGPEPEAETAAASRSARPDPAAARAGEPVLDASGYVTARRRATVSSKVTGKIVEVLVEEGMAVEAGQVLARLDDSTQRAAVALAEASLEAARRALAETGARLTQARLERGRADRLVRQAVAPQADLDSASTEVDALAARLELERGRVEVAQRELILQRVALTDTVIRAPFAGVAVSKNAQPGEMISPVSAGGGFTRTGVCTLVDMSGAGILGSVGQAAYSAAKAGIATLTLVQAAELGRYGVTANALCPAARTRMTEGVFTEMMATPDQPDAFDAMAPENVSPLVAWLASAQSAHVTGRMFEVEGGKVGIATGWQHGPTQDKGARWDPAEIGPVIDELLAQAPEPAPVYGTG